jgi:pimeloyl-ACP methyl ester carboxylesterase
MTLLEQAIRTPERFERLVLCGIGESVLRPPEPHTIIDALEGRGAPEDIRAQVFVQYATQPGNDLAALTACMKADRVRPDRERLARVTCPTLVVIGDRDEAGPGQPLVDALPDARLVTLRNVDHFATTGDFGCIDAVLAFLG